jgi:hypothetical protein
MTLLAVWSDTAPPLVHLPLEVGKRQIANTLLCWYMLR